MDNITLTRLSKEKEILSRMQSKNTKISISDDSRQIEVNFTTLETTVTYYISLPERYPFLSPKVTANIPNNLICLYKDTNDMLDIILGDQWTPAISLEKLIEKIILFSQQSISIKKPYVLKDLGLLGSVMIAVVLRSTMFLQPSSDSNTAIQYEDFKKYKHWMEITNNLSTDLWYKSTLEVGNNHWPINHPPLSAWYSYLVGLVVSYVDPKALELGSNDYRSDVCIFIMRISVLIGDFMFYIPGLVLFFWILYRNIQKKIVNLGIFTFLLSPQLILIDYGHFQYNNVVLGFSLIAIGLGLRKDVMFSGIFLALAMNFQLAGWDYFLPFMVYWVFISLDQASKESYSYSANIRTIAKYGILATIISIILGSMIITSVVVWSPWFNDEDMKTVINKIQYTHGNDSVSVLWSLINILTRNSLNDFITSIEFLIKVIISFPFLYILTQKKAANECFIYTLAGFSLSLFLFSYRIHETDIIIPLLPISLATVLNYPDIFQLSVITGTFSLYSILVSDGLEIPYFVLQGLFYVISDIHARILGNWAERKQVKWTYFIIVLLHILKKTELFGKYFNILSTFHVFVVFCYVLGFLMTTLNKFDEGSSGIGKNSKIKAV